MSKFNGRLRRLESVAGAPAPVMITIQWGDDKPGRTFPAPADSKLTEDTIIRVVSDR